MGTCSYAPLTPLLRGGGYHLSVRHVQAEAWPPPAGIRPAARRQRIGLDRVSVVPLHTQGASIVSPIVQLPTPSRRLCVSAQSLSLFVCLVMQMKQFYYDTKKVYGD